MTTTYFFSESNMALTSSEFNFLMKIPNISKLDTIESAVIKIHEIPWKVKIFKRSVFNTDLVISLICGKTDDSQWSHAAQTSVKLLSFDSDQKANEIRCDPHIFSSTSLISCTERIIEWDNIFDTKNNYVDENDAIILKIKIKVADPNDENRSIVTLEPLKMSSEVEVSSVFKLTITNISTLMAVKTPAFIMEDTPWFLQIYTCSNDYLMVGLSVDSSSSVNCNVRVSCKLISSKPQLISKEIVQTICSHNKFPHYVGTLATWKTLFDPQNGFVNGNSIQIEVVIKMDKFRAVSVVEKSRQQMHKNFVRLECVICFKDFTDQDASSTQCGHIFCTECIKNVIRSRKVCPICNTSVTSNRSLRRVLFPM